MARFDHGTAFLSIVWVHRINYKVIHTKSAGKTPHSISVSATDGQLIAGNEHHHHDHQSATNNARWPSSHVAIMFRPMALQSGAHMFLQLKKKKL